MMTEASDPIGLMRPVPNSFEELLDSLLCKAPLVIAQTNNDCTSGSIPLTGTGGGTAPRRGR